MRTQHQSSAENSSQRRLKRQNGKKKPDQDFDKTIIKLAKAFKIPSLEWQDTAQELRLHLWIKRKKYDKKKKSYENWAYIVCRKKIIDLARYYKAKKRHTKIVNIDDLEI